MKIATLGNAAAVHTQRWVEHFRARGHDVALWSLEPGPEGLGARGLEALPLPGFVRYPLTAPVLRREVRAFAPDLVDAHYVPNYGLLGALIGVHPLSVTAWGSDLLVLGQRGALQRARLRYVLRRADLVLADAENLAAAARTLGAPPDRVACIPWGVELWRYREAPAREPGLIVSTRRMEPIYDLPTVIQGVAKVMATRQDTRLVLAGDGPSRSEIERLAAQLLPAGRFQFVGQLDAAGIAEWLGRAEIYVSASHSDSTSLSLLEAMACGTMPVVSDLEGNREWVKEGEGARLFPPGDSAALAHALEQTLADPEWRVRARHHNRQVVERRADHARNMAEIEARFQALASRAR
ncbi:MAG TPA: glycosyltransferase [Candidatus Eisenbacteria bacterium]|nr:glycosyltransferase [Candidatus Eisenbacteria bacterium]